MEESELVVGESPYIEDAQIGEDTNTKIFNKAKEHYDASLTEENLDEDKITKILKSFVDFFIEKSKGEETTESMFIKIKLYNEYLNLIKKKNYDNKSDKEKFDILMLTNANTLKLKYFESYINPTEKQFKISITLPNNTNKEITDDKRGIINHIILLTILHSFKFCMNYGEYSSYKEPGQIIMNEETKKAVFEEEVNVVVPPEVLKITDSIIIEPCKPNEGTNEGTSKDEDEGEDATTDASTGATRDEINTQQQNILLLNYPDQFENKELFKRIVKLMDEKDNETEINGKYIEYIYDEITKLDETNLLTFIKDLNNFVKYNKIYTNGSTQYTYFKKIYIKNLKGLLDELRKKKDSITIDNDNIPNSDITKEFVSLDMQINEIDKIITGGKTIKKRKTPKKKAKKTNKKSFKTFMLFDEKLFWVK